MLNQTLLDAQSAANTKIGDITQRKTIREETRKAMGVPESAPKTAIYDKWAQNAENMFTELRKLDSKTDEVRSPKGPDDGSDDVLGHPMKVTRSTRKMSSKALVEKKTSMRAVTALRRRSMPVNISNGAPDMPPPNPA